MKKILFEHISIEQKSQLLRLFAEQMKLLRHIKHSENPTDTTAPIMKLKQAGRMRLKQAGRMRLKQAGRMRLKQAGRMRL